MSMASSTSYSVAAMPTSVGRGLLRWAVLGAAGVIALILALTHSTVAGAQVPANCIPINFGTCVANGTAYSTGTVGTNVGTTTTSNTGFPGNAAVSAPYFDNRYGFVQVVTDNSGNLIDVNPATGQRIFPFLPDFGFGGVIGNSFIGANFNNGFVNGRFVNGGVFNNGFNGFNGNFNNGFNGFNGFNGINGGFFNNNGVFPAGATNVGGGVFTYNDNRFCGDGKLFFVVGRGSFCQNSGGFANGNGGFINANFRGFEVAPTTPQQATTVTAYAAPATPKAAAPVVQAAAPIVQAAAPVVQAAAPITQAAVPVVQAAVAPKVPVTAPAAAAPAAKVVTTMNAPTTQQAVPVVAKAQVTAPVAATTLADPDDHRG